jgi:hypothetical protein
MNLEQIVSVATSLVNKNYDCRIGVNGIRFKNYYELGKFHETDLVVTWAWSTGGYSGGSCWGDEAQPYSTDNGPPEVDVLDTLMEQIAPNISFIVYKNIRSKLIKPFNYSESEYYGNYTDYSGRAFSLNELYVELTNAGLA